MQQHIAEKVFHSILNIIIVLAIIVMIFVTYNYIQLHFLGKEYTNFFGYTIFEISTGSMKDTLNVYDIILVKITKDVQLGDIITYSNENETITHRVISINENEIVTKGDANNTQDTKITKDMVIGKVVSSYSKIGIWIRVFSDYKVLISVFITLMLIEKSISKDRRTKK